MNIKTVGFCSEQTRFETSADKTDIPGPGQYEGVLAAFGNIKNHRSHNKSQQTFGSIQRRLLWGKIEPLPGPGAYKPEVSQSALDHIKYDIT